MSFLKTLLEKLLGFFAVFLLGKQHEKTSQAKKKTKAALKEAQRHASFLISLIICFYHFVEWFNLW